MSKSFQGPHGVRVLPGLVWMLLGIMGPTDSQAQGRGWQRMPNLPVPLLNASAAANGTHVFVAGGASGGLEASNVQNKVYSAAIQPDGSLGPFVEAGQIPFGARAGMGMGHHKGHLYMFGGYSAENYAVKGDIAIVETRPDGRLGKRLPTKSQMPRLGGLTLGDGFGRSNLVHQGLILIMSGEAGSPNPNVPFLYTNAIRADGDIAAGWLRSSQENPVKGGVWNNAVAMTSDKNGRILAFSIGGQLYPNSGTFGPQRTTNQVTVAAINPATGICDAWVPADPLPVRKQAAQAVAISNRIYVVGGTADESSADDALCIGTIDTGNGRIRWAYQPGSLPSPLAVPCATIYRSGSRAFLGVIGGSSAGNGDVWVLEISGD